MDSVALKPCPFCGGEAKFHGGLEVIPVIDENGAYIDADFNVWPAWVECSACGATGEAFDNDEDTDEDTDEDKAIASWNRRVDQ